MPTAKAPDSKRRLVWMGVGGLALIGVLFVFTGGSDTPASKAVATKSTHSGAANSSSDIYTAYDTKVKYEPLRTASRDVFMPLIAKTAPTVDLSQQGGIAAALADGEGWAYTGMGEIDGKPVAIIENSKTGESDMLALGQRWKKAKVRSISDYQLVLIDEKGKDVAVKMGEPEAAAKSIGLGTLPPAGIQPAPLTGQIGALDVTPMAQPQVDQTGANGGNGGGNGGGGRRRGRGRGNGAGNGAAVTDNGG